MRKLRMPYDPAVGQRSMGYPPRVLHAYYEKSDCNVDALIWRELIHNWLFGGTYFRILTPQQFVCKDLSQTNPSP